MCRYQSRVTREANKMVICVRLILLCYHIELVDSVSRESMDGNTNYSQLLSLYNNILLIFECFMTNISPINPEVTNEIGRFKQCESLAMVFNTASSAQSHCFFTTYKSHKALPTMPISSFVHNYVQVNCYSIRKFCQWAY